MSKELSKTYDPKDIEDRLYANWEKMGYFHAEVDRSKKPFTIVMPPPNITGQLHMGHALDNTMQDIIIRYKRMQGYSALWLPGTDHASIATEVKVVEQIAKEGLTKEDLGREKFLDRVWDWKKEYGGRIVKQLRKMGSSADWQRERFTMDEGCNKAVKEVFVNLYNKGMIYRGERIINWCPCCLTSLSDAEVEYEDQAGHFWHLRYPLSDGSGYIQMATTRPETMLGDTAVAVNPKDERYKDYVGKTVILPIVHREIPIIADDYVDMEFGTGVVKITPAHDPNDFEVGQRHNLAIINVLTDDAKITDDYPEFAGMDRYEAREAIVKALDAEGALVKIEDHDHNVGTCYRCHTTIEPRVSKQWFVKMDELAKPAIDAVKNNETRFVPEHFEKTYFHWLENIKDWCISRQLWWGHRIPAFYCDECGELVVTKEDHCNCPKCGKPMRQDPDTLDTWFSSALWPFSTLGWPDKTEDLDYFYPTNVLVTGYDIILFWVMRMMFSGIEHTGKAPFDTVLIHGLVRDSQGRKMSKSLGNGIDPLEIIDQYGADALRLTLITGNAPGNDMRFYMERVEASRNFANKVWNASRFIMMNLEGMEIKEPSIDELHTADKWILSRVNTLAKDMTENMDKYELGIAVQKVYDFIWDEFCDWYIEIAKVRTYKKDEDPASANAALWTLRTALTNGLKMLHPFMPFITEEIFTTLCPEEETIMLSAWPEYKEEWNFTDAEAALTRCQDLVRAVRNTRTSMEVPPSRKAKLILVSEDAAVREVFEANKEVYVNLAFTNGIEIQSDKTGISENAVSCVIPDAVCYLPLEDLVDFEKERERLTKEKEKLTKELARSRGMLSNEKFLSNAKPEKVAEEKEKLAKYEQMMASVEERLSQM
ncbi:MULTISPECIES: valine--tRNA ligase [Agathobacter]|uniref:Valine--tRNA ligase n=1 Tax=Agathobacter ruminis TaxID=1712665 RepID=A0A2G3E0P3_9FIRM|nr:MULTISPECIES: valine--tRNA ligase [Agathobacter]MBQ1680780.1 valine--tRNA ligase [Agathobacter sp.]MDC7301319.1 valine--tRNA ligase [Agathobacter ruminis]PHU36801.1 valine--tRNA ligase [Agathobacter ruminis]